MSTRPLKGLVLAGGKGTRLRPLTYAMAKQMVPVANKPILHYALDELYKGGVRDFGIIISPETGEAIRDCVTQWAPWDVTVEYIPQEQPLGLAHAVKIAQPYLQDDDFVMYLGDNLINGNLARLVQDFRDNPCEAAILLKPVDNPSAFGVAELDAHQNVIRLVEKPKDPPSNLALIGVYLFTSAIFDAIEQIQPSWRGELEITDAIQQLIDSHKTVRSSIHPGWWLDTGKKDDLLAANRTVLTEYLETRIPSQALLESHTTGPVDIGVGSVLINCQLEGPIRIGVGCRITDTRIGPYTSIGDGCTIAACAIENSVILENCHLEKIPGKIEESLIGQGCRIVKSDGVQESHKFLLADHSEIQVL